VENQNFADDKLFEVDDTRQGCVYILRRRDTQGILKVGFSSREAQLRAQSYTDGDWAVHAEFAMPVWLAKMTERAAHEVLKAFWLDPKVTGGTAHEIFMCQLEIAEEAVNLARIECIDKALKSLGIQPFVIDLLLSGSGLSNNPRDDLNEAYERKLKDLSHQLSSANEALKSLKDCYETLARELESTTSKLRASEATHKVELTRLEDNYGSELRTLESSYLDLTKDFSRELKMLEAVADNKLNPHDFDLLRSRFREAVDMLRTLRYRDNKEKHS